MKIFETSSKRIVIILCIIGIFSLITFALAAATLGTLNRRLNSMVPTMMNPTKPKIDSVLAETIRIDDLMNHLKQLQRIADESNGNRAINTRGFNETVNYIYNYLQNQVKDLQVKRQTFQLKDFVLAKNPIFFSLINGIKKNYTYSTVLARSEFTYVNYSTAANFTDYISIVYIPNYGCNENEWQNVSGFVALIKGGGKCTFSEKSVLAKNNGAKAILFYSNGETSNNLAPLNIRLRQSNQLPALSLSYAVGKALIDALTTDRVAVKFEIELKNLATFPVDNVCADTLNGDATQTIVIGSHSDSVPIGPGINDNGSGTAANLVLATNLVRLYRTANYTKYKYRVRFCWWAGEEIGLAGSSYHVQNAQNMTEPGERLQDYLLNLNFDMAGSPNFIFGIYDAKTAVSGTPVSALPGSTKITDLYRDWFIRQNLPWDYRDFNGRSDYGPFLAAGIAAGGVATGSDAIKTAAQREKYRQSIGKNNAGFAGAILDPCYHQSCDTLTNIHLYGYEKLVQAAAYGLECLGQHPDLLRWLYPNGRT